MSDPESLLRNAASDLGKLNARWALIGGLAVGVRSEPRFTRDVDLAVAVATDAEAESIVFRLQPLGYEVLASLEHEKTKRLATVRLRPIETRDPTLVLDLLFASSGIEPEIVEAATEVEIVRGFVAPVAMTGHLIALKLLARADHRPDDEADLVRLIADLEPDELERARLAVRLIAERGFARGKDLESDLESLLKWR